MNKEGLHTFNMERFDLKKLNEVEVSCCGLKCVCRFGH
jgi:hypothetical protein